MQVHHLTDMQGIPAPKPDLLLALAFCLDRLGEALDLPAAKEQQVRTLPHAGA